MKDMIDECERLRGLIAKPDDDRPPWPIFPKVWWMIYWLVVGLALFVVFFVMG
jgi:hypothetical protein